MIMKAKITFIVTDPDAYTVTESLSLILLQDMKMSELEVIGAITLESVARTLMNWEIKE